MLFTQAIFYCDVCPADENGKQQVCHNVEVWINGAAGVILHEVTCERCGKVEKYRISSLELITDFEEASSIHESLAERQEVVM